MSLWSATTATCFSAITSGGSQAVFFKLNTLGEESFLEKLVPIVENYKKRVE